MDSTAATLNDSSSDSTDSSVMLIENIQEDPELDKFYDPESFESLSNDGVKIIARNSTNYSEIKSEFETLFNMDDPNFDESNYKQFVTMAMTLNDQDNIRKACTKYCTLYGYEDSLVLSWLYRELKEYVATGDKAILEYMFKDIFQKSLTEKYSRIIVYKLAHFAKHYPDPDAIWNYIFDRFLYDFESPGKLVKLWTSTLDGNDPKHSEKLVEVYERVLAIPHLDMDKTYIDFKVMVTKEPDRLKVDWDYIQEDFEKAQSEADLMIAYENELECATADNRATMFKLYLSEVGDKLDRKVRRFIFERMVAECSDSSCWLMYLNYLRDRCEDEEVEQVLDRAIHLGEPHDQLFRMKMEILERKKNSRERAEIKEELTRTIEMALASPFAQPEMSTRVWLEYLTVLRRLTDCGDEAEVDVLRKNFDLAWSSLSRQWGDAADTNGEILKFQARLEYAVLANPEQGRDLWNSVLGLGTNSQNVGIWLEFAECEATVNKTFARRLFKRALHNTELLDPETLASAWIRFERVYGDADQLKNCQSHCDEVLDKFYKMWQETEQIKQQEEQSSRPRKEKGEKKGRKRGLEGSSSSRSTGPAQKRSKSDDTRNRMDEPVSGRSREVPKEPVSGSGNDNLKVFLSNLVYTIQEAEIKSAFPELNIRNVSLGMGPSGKSRGFCCLELASEKEVQLALSFDRRPINERPTFISTYTPDKSQRTKKFYFDEGLDPKKLFVKGCGNSTQEELETLFNPFGLIKEIRMVFHKNGKSKGIAFVEYDSESAASAAVLKMDQHELNGQILSVSLSSPPMRAEKRPDSIQSLGNANRQTTSVGGKKPRLSFIPSSVLKKHTH